MATSLIQTSATLGALAKGIDARFLDVFDENVDNYTSALDSVFQVRDSQQKREHTKLKAGVGRLDIKKEGDAVQRTDQKLSFETEYLHDTYSKGVTVTLENIQDRDFEEKLDEFSALSRAAVQTKDQAKAQVLNGGFATTNLVNGYNISLLNDAVPLFSTVHPLKIGGTTSNASSTGAPLNDTSLEGGRKSIIEQKTDDDRPMALQSRLTLIVPPNLRKKALQLTGSELEPETSNNGINVYRGEIDVMEITWLSSTNGGSDTSWYLVGAGQAKLMFMNRLSPMFDLSVDNNTKNRNYDVLARWSVGHSDWRFTYASKGDNLAYSS